MGTFLVRYLLRAPVRPDRLRVSEDGGTLEELGRGASPGAVLPTKGRAPP